MRRSYASILRSFISWQVSGVYVRASWLAVASYLYAGGTAFAAVTNLTVSGVTSTQAIVTYTCPDLSADYIEVSTVSNFSTVVNDVNATLYPGSNLGSRAGNLNIAGKTRVFVVGKQGQPAMVKASDGYTRSLALQAAKEHYVRVTCGADTATTEFTTANILTGDTRGVAVPTDPDLPFTYKSIAANPAAFSEFTDPYTGALYKRPLEQFTYGFGAVTSQGADCNKTLTGVAASCMFDEAFGTGWSATDAGTLTNAVRGNDSNYAEYSGTTQQPLYLRMDWATKYPTESSSEQVGSLGFQNIIIPALTTDATGDGGVIDICIVDDVNRVSPEPQCISPLRQATLTETETILRICKDSPCSNPDQPGDIMLDRYPVASYLYPNTRVYNTAGSLTIWKFTGSGAQNTCDELVVGDRLKAVDTSATYAERIVTVNSKDCGNTPPQVTVNLSYNMLHEGTTGVTLWREAGFSTNKHIGIRIRKVSTTSGSTIKINYPLWRLARNTPIQFANGSGGFGKRCQTILTAGGEYLCLFNQHIVGISYGSEGLTLNNYGYAYSNTNFINGGVDMQDDIGLFSAWNGGNDTLWSDTVPGRLYASMPSSYNNPATSTVDNRQVIVELNIDISAPKTAGDPTASGTPGLGNKAQRFTTTSHRIVTPCLDSPCNSEANDYTPYAQMKRFLPSWQPAVFDSLSLQAVIGNKITGYYRTGGQDSHAYLIAFDLGNEQPIGGGYVGTYGNTQHLFAAFSMPECYETRWCAEHTFQAPLTAGGDDFVVIEGSDKCQLQVTATSSLSSCSVAGTLPGTPGTCDACPAVELDGINYSGRSHCGTLNITSAWDGGWETEPAGFAAGDPVAPSGCSNGAPTVHGWGQKLAVGDFLWSGNEFVRVIEKVSNTQLTIIRGWGGRADHGVYGPKTHGSSDVWQTRCGARGRNPDTANPEAAQGIVWHPEQDPDGTDSTYTFLSIFQNHAWHGEGRAAKPEFDIISYSDAATLKSAVRHRLQTPSSFAGKTTNCGGNACEEHPSYGQVNGNVNAKSWFGDIHPRLFKASTGSTAASLAAGKTYIYCWNGTIDWKHFEVEAYTALSPFRFANTLADDPADSGKACINTVADACFSGATAGKVCYVNEAQDIGFVDGSVANSCREQEFGNINGDICIHNSNGISAVTSQWRLPSTSLTTASLFPNGVAVRAVGKHDRTYRESATENVKEDPLGRVLFFRRNFYAWLPPFPGETSKSGSTFVAIPSTKNGVPAGTANAYIEFGYDSNFYCHTQRNDVCRAESATLNPTTPYVIGAETITGLSCASGCTIAIPALRNRILYYRWVFRNSGGSVLHTGATQVMAVE